MLSFHADAIIAAIVCFVLTITWIFAPKLLLSIWGVCYSHPVGLISRRGGALFLCLGVMLFLARNAAPSPARTAITTGFIVGCLALACLGIFELVRKRAHLGILSAVMTEIILAILFIFQI